VTGCSGGPLNVENPFICKSRIRKIAKNKRLSDFDRIKNEYTLDMVTWHTEIEPHSILKLDKDFKVAIQKMTKIEEFLKELPGIDCGACGSPTCRSLAEDVVMGRATIEDCLVKK